MRLFAGVIQQMALELERLVPVIDQPRDIKQHLTRIRELEREGDEIYREAMKDVCDYLGNTIDRCQLVGDLAQQS